jgi:hypothetical protein
MRRKAAIGPVQSTRVKQAVEKNTGDLQGADVRRIQGKAIEIAKEKARALNRPYREISAGPRSLQNFSRAPRRVLDEEVPLSGIFASLQIQGIYRRFTGNREIRFFGSGVARSVRPGRVRREAIGPWRAQQRAVSVALEQQNAPEAVGSGRANVTLHLLPCAARAEGASGIQSIPAIQGCADHGRSTRRAGRPQQASRAGPRFSFRAWLQGMSTGSSRGSRSLLAKSGGRCCASERPS